MAAADNNERVFAGSDGAANGWHPGVVTVVENGFIEAFGVFATSVDEAVEGLNIAVLPGMDHLSKPDAGVRKRGEGFAEVAVGFGIRKLAKRGGLSLDFFECTNGFSSFLRELVEVVIEPEFASVATAGEI